MNQNQNKVLVAGATGNLGKRIVRELKKRGATVVAATRPETAPDKTEELERLGADIVRVDFADAPSIAAVCAGSVCVVSALAGLRDVIVGTQSALLAGAVAAGVPRFIPSDFSTDYTKLTPGENRNFDLRREFNTHIESAPIAVTSIFNGAFAEILTYNIPLLDRKNKSVGYWEDPDWRLDFTTMDDTAAYTAAAALDDQTPRALRIASFQISPRELAAVAEEMFGEPYPLVRMGNLAELREYNRRERAAHPEGENELYATWQQSQYLQSMFSTHHETLDNDRYPNLAWSPIRSVFA